MQTQVNFSLPSRWVYLHPVSERISQIFIQNFRRLNNQPRPQSHFSPSSYSEKMRWGLGWINSIAVTCLVSLEYSLRSITIHECKDNCFKDIFDNVK